eukprot:365953-Chlamydomonas_euryale.AAC.2
MLRAVHLPPGARPWDSYEGGSARESVADLAAMLQHALHGPHDAQQLLIRRQLSKRAQRVGRAHARSVHTFMQAGLWKARVVQWRGRLLRCGLCARQEDLADVAVCLAEDGPARDGNFAGPADGTAYYGHHVQFSWQATKSVSTGDVVRRMLAMPGCVASVIFIAMPGCVACVVVLAMPGCFACVIVLAMPGCFACVIVLAMPGCVACVIVRVAQSSLRPSIVAQLSSLTVPPWNACQPSIVPPLPIFCCRLPPL